jgi:hypothetical protein
MSMTAVSVMLDSFSPMRVDEDVRVLKAAG